MARTGLYRVRKGWFGKCVLQYQSRTLRSDWEGNGYVFRWYDETFINAPAQMEKVEYTKGLSE